LHKCLLERSLGISEEGIRNQQNIAYVRGAEEALERARAGKANVSFLMNPVPMRAVRDIAFAGGVMPHPNCWWRPPWRSSLEHKRRLPIRPRLDRLLRSPLKSLCSSCSTRLTAAPIPAHGSLPRLPKRRSPSISLAG